MNDFENESIFLQMKLKIFRYPFPIDMENDYIFYSLYVHQAFTSVALGQMAAATGTLMFSMLLYFNYQIKLLGYRFSKCGSISELDDVDKYKEFIDCIEMHHEMKKCVF